MGNPLLKQYHVDSDPLIRGTRHGRWTVHSGYHLDRPNVPVSLFVSQVHSGYHLDRPNVPVSLFACNLKAPEFAALPPDGSVLQQLRELLQQDAQLLQRLRHPRLLQVVEPLQQGKDSWVFCTKPVSTSLKSLLGAPTARGGPQASGGGPSGYSPPDSARGPSPRSSAITSLSSSSNPPSSSSSMSSSGSSSSSSSSSRLYRRYEDLGAEAWRCARRCVTPRRRFRVYVQLLYAQQQMYFLFVFLFVSVWGQPIYPHAEMETQKHTVNSVLCCPLCVRLCFLRVLFFKKQQQEHQQQQEEQQQQQQKQQQQEIS
ncbi:uncharacterized protein EMH_0069050 [Eimeria mitis]|uniref:Uncharacterized protein n=1 Tax=Eimeria mitis TaxID=44415 RepID=U6K1U6_9EIME|nr:uncharacterized protein EMH_0069050 [Eimeria mitis]CDJ31715.1 hypothetical protein EMH_0069050 [Eimeria mitis]